MVVMEMLRVVGVLIAQLELELVLIPLIWPHVRDQQDKPGVIALWVLDVLHLTPVVLHATTMPLALGALLLLVPSLHISVLAFQQPALPLVVIPPQTAAIKLLVHSCMLVIALVVEPTQIADGVVLVDMVSVWQAQAVKVTAQLPILEHGGIRAPI